MCGESGGGGFAMCFAMCACVCGEGGDGSGVFFCSVCGGVMEVVFVCVGFFVCSVRTYVCGGGW